jgi:hypothetical protein
MKGKVEEKQGLRSNTQSEHAVIVDDSNSVSVTIIQLT